MTSLHRSKLFWFGLLGLAFLLWTWADSRRNSAYVSWGSPRWKLGIGSYGSQLNITQVDGGMILGGAGNGFGWQRDRSGRGATVHGWLKHPVYERTSHAAGNSLFIAVPFWMIVLPYLAAWGTGQAHRCRRLKRATLPHPISAS